MAEIATTLSAAQTAELVDTYLWQLFWFIVCLLLVMVVADHYHGRNSN